MQHIVQADRQLPVLPEALVRPATLVRVLPGMPDDLRVPRNVAFLYPAGRLGLDLQVRVADGPEPASIRDENDVREGSGTSCLPCVSLEA